MSDFILGSESARHRVHDKLEAWVTSEAYPRLIVHSQNWPIVSPLCRRTAKVLVIEQKNPTLHTPYARICDWHVATKK